MTWEFVSSYSERATAEQKGREIIGECKVEYNRLGQPYLEYGRTLVTSDCYWLKNLLQYTERITDVYGRNVFALRVTFSAASLNVSSSDIPIVHSIETERRSSSYVNTIYLKPHRPSPVAEGNTEQYCLLHLKKDSREGLADITLVHKYASFKNFKTIRNEIKTRLGQGTRFDLISCTSTKGVDKTEKLYQLVDDDDSIRECQDLFYHWQDSIPKTFERKYRLCNGYEILGSGRTMVVQAPELTENQRVFSGDILVLKYVWKIQGNSYSLVNVPSLPRNGTARDFIDVLGEKALIFDVNEKKGDVASFQSLCLNCGYQDNVYNASIEIFNNSGDIDFIKSIQSAGFGVEKFLILRREAFANNQLPDTVVAIVLHGDQSRVSDFGSFFAANHGGRKLGDHLVAFVAFDGLPGTFKLYDDIKPDSYGKIHFEDRRTSLQIELDKPKTGSSRCGYNNCPLSSLPVIFTQEGDYVHLHTDGKESTSLTKGFLRTTEGWNDPRIDTVCMFGGCTQAMTDFKNMLDIYFRTALPRTQDGNMVMNCTDVKSGGATRNNVLQETLGMYLKPGALLMKKCLFVAGTGSGKGGIIARAVERYYKHIQVDHKNFDKILIVVPDENLKAQMFREIQEFCKEFMEVMFGREVVRVGEMQDAKGKWVWYDPMHDRFKANLEKGVISIVTLNDLRKQLSFEEQAGNIANRNYWDRFKPHFLDANRLALSTTAVFIDEVHMYPPEVLKCLSTCPIIYGTTATPYDFDAADRSKNIDEILKDKYAPLFGEDIPVRNYVIFGSTVGTFVKPTVFEIEPYKLTYPSKFLGQLFGAANRDPGIVNKILEPAIYSIYCQGGWADNIAHSLLLKYRKPYTTEKVVNHLGDMVRHISNGKYRTDQTTVNHTLEIATLICNILDRHPDETVSIFASVNTVFNAVLDRVLKHNSREILSIYDDMSNVAHSYSASNRVTPTRKFNGQSGTNEALEYWNAAIGNTPGNIIMVDRGLIKAGANIKHCTYTIIAVDEYMSVSDILQIAGRSNRFCYSQDGNDIEFKVYLLFGAFDGGDEKKKECAGLNAFLRETQAGLSRVNDLQNNFNQEFVCCYPDRRDLFSTYRISQHF